MVDWTHSLSTTDPDYYKWTQWVFLQLLKQGLAYKKQAAVNWCPSCKTVLANEQVIGGACERCDTPVEQRFLSQWFFRISDYAQRLLMNLDTLDWSETTKTAQRNWIGRSEGAEITFTAKRNGDEHAIRVFTTRPDTVFGATYLVLAPEHPLVSALTGSLYKSAVEQYIARSSKQDVVTRKSNTEKTGVFTGAYALNPATGQEIPIWISDYVLMEYGTGAIMAVPGHDERDFEFAKVFGLPIVRVVCAEGEEPSAPLDAAFTENERGLIVNSGRFDGMTVATAKREITSMLEAAGAGKPFVNYRLHDWCISRQRYWGPPIPIIYCDDHGAVPVPEKDLPVVLPHVDDFKPDDSGVSPLARHEDWYRVPCPECGKIARRETDVSDTFLDSAWYFLRYPSVGIDETSVRFEPDAEVAAGEQLHRWKRACGAASACTRASSRWCFTTWDTSTFEEPFTRFRAHGLIIRNGAKMSKSRGNVVIPDHYIEKWGADAFRTYLMFLGPFEEGGDFRDASISGVKRFLDRLWASVSVAVDGSASNGSGRSRRDAEAASDDQESRRGHSEAELQHRGRRDDGVHERSTPRRANARARRGGAARSARGAIRAAHCRGAVAEARAPRVVFSRARWPAYDDALASDEKIELVVQVNGKTRGKLSVVREIDQDAAVAAATGRSVDCEIRHRRAEENHLRSWAASEYRGVARDTGQREGKGFVRPVRTTGKANYTEWGRTEGDGETGRKPRFHVLKKTQKRSSPLLPISFSSPPSVYLAFP